VLNFIMITALAVIFVVAYTCITLEHSLKINKSATALLGAGLLWTVYASLSSGDHDVGHDLAETLVGTAQIVFFLMGAMTIVEVVDAHNAFEIITSRIKTTRLPALMWLAGGRDILPERRPRQCSPGRRVHGHVRARTISR
jgi:Na+/H+ antiporter NhaD/arsenite permease-like protein